MKLLAAGTLMYAVAAQAPQTPAPRAALETQVLATIAQVADVEAIAGTMALDKGMDARTRRFGQRLLLDRSAIGSMLADYSAAHDLPVPEAPGITISPRLQAFQQRIEQARVAALTTLPTLTGGSFDGEFLRLMETSNKTGVAALAWAGRQFPDSPIGSLIGGVIPFFEQHYTIAAQLDLERARRAGGD